MIQTTVELINRHAVGPAQELTLRAPRVRPAPSVPGQAVLMKTGWGLEPYLRRTFYPIAIGDEAWAIRVLRAGRGAMPSLRATAVGTTIDCLGPVGIGYLVPLGVRNVLCIGVGESTWTLMPVVVQAEVHGVYPWCWRWKRAPAAS